MKTGIELIAAERKRQVRVEGWTAEHDDAYTDRQELILAAMGYLKAAGDVQWGNELDDEPTDWPWDKRWWKPSTDSMRNLEKAGALIAAEIDRIQRFRAKTKQAPNPKAEAPNHER